MSIKTLSIANLEESDKGSVWVFNSGKDSILQLNGDIILSIPGTNNQQGQALRIPNTWIPIDLTTRFPKRRILESTDFRSAVHNGLLTITDEETAQRFLKQEGALEEMRRMRDEALAVREAGSAHTIADSGVEIHRADGSKDRDDADDSLERVKKEKQEINVGKMAKAGLETDENGLTASFIMFATKISTEPDISALNALRTRSKFTRRELKYLRNNLPSHPKTLAAIKLRLKADKNV